MKDVGITKLSIVLIITIMTVQVTCHTATPHVIDELKFEGSVDI